MSEYFLFRCVAGHRVISSKRVDICTAALLKDGRPDAMYQRKDGLEPQRVCGEPLQELNEEEEDEYYSER